MGVLQFWYMGVLQQGSSLQEVIMFSKPESVMLQACADKLEREIQLYCDPDKPGSPPVFPDEEPGAAVSQFLGPMLLQVNVLAPLLLQVIVLAPLLLQANV